MTFPVGFHPEALAETAAAVAWYRERSEAAGAALETELDRAIARISDRPDRYPSLIEVCRLFLLRHFPFSVMYWFDGKQVEIVAIAHHRRRPGYWRERSK